VAAENMFTICNEDSPQKKAVECSNQIVKCKKIEIVLKWKKFIFDHPTLAKVWFWPSNSKTGYLWASNYQDRSNLTIGLFR
jgi:hypothetical protein